MLTRPEAADPAVEDLKRRARRRLVGAVVLALAAAVTLPLLLESDPRPLGDGVSIRIAPIDSGRPGTPPPPAKGSDAKAPDRPETRPSTPPEPAAADAPVEARARGADASNSKPDEPVQAAPADAAPSRAPATSTPDVAPNPEPQKSAAFAAGAGVSSSHVADLDQPAGGFVIQLAALVDAKAAGALASKLKSAGFPAYTEALKTHQGTMRRVRVGPYATREAADAQLAKVNAAGFHGVVAVK